MESTKGDMMAFSIKGLVTSIGDKISETPNSTIGKCFLSILTLSGAAFVWYAGSAKLEDILEELSDEKDVSSEESSNEIPIEVEVEVID